MGLSSLVRPASWLRRPWKPLALAKSNFTKLLATKKIEEEAMPGYVAKRYYSARIGEIFEDRYQVIGKLGYGATSTVWLARDMHKPTAHPGRPAIRSLLGRFNVDGPVDTHQCLIHVPLWENVWTFLHRNPIQRLPTPVLAFVLRRVFLALDYLHTECHIIHTDIKADNIMFEIGDESVLHDFERGELQHSSLRKELDGRIIYESRELGMPKKMGAPVLCDLGSAVIGDTKHLEDVQPNIYRAPEVILEVPWTYSIDIWNVGCMIWDIFEGGSLFTGRDPESQTYRSRAHLAEMIDILGPPPPSLIAQGQLSPKFFDEKGIFLVESLLLERTTLERRETNLDGPDQADFLRFVRRMLQWDPTKCSSAKSLAEDTWILKQLQS
ncbi:protein kinase domain protein [Moelleriella libera RCEF 2490]|uniref:non-specific serine/threonine protein kinase n=1 Tax=Moelleriella libera RCEF 2490 TaxID=1081109 RepID=A0A166NDQ8_9HYPO|nr:protein kinase domain protein [Moelleriella libera RCEF 2490]